MGSCWGFVSLLTWDVLLVEQGHEAEMDGGLCKKQTEDWVPPYQSLLLPAAGCPFVGDLCLNHTPDGTHFTGWEQCLQDVSEAPHPASWNMGLFPGAK